MDAVAVHGDKDQADREAAIQAFKLGQKDVLVATDVASKGLDFPDIQHVVNYGEIGSGEGFVRMQQQHRVIEKGSLLVLVRIFTRLLADMPDEIENYVHRIGRTGRCGKTGVATTFINTRFTNETILLDLKHLLKVRVCARAPWLFVSTQFRLKNSVVLVARLPTDATPLYIPPHGGCRRPSSACRTSCSRSRTRSKRWSSWRQHLASRGARSAAASATEPRSAPSCRLRTKRRRARTGTISGAADSGERCNERDGWQ